MRKIKEFISKALLYFLLILIGFVFLYPIFYMISYSFMDTEDLVNPFVKWIPTKLYLENYKSALNVLNYKTSLISSIYVALIPSLLQIIFCSVTGYGLARFDFKGKKIILFLIIATFIIPSQVTMIPQFLMYKDLNLIGSLYSFILPAIFSQGLRSSIFILIFYQFFKMFPKSLEEAAKIDGANYLTIFLRIAVPSALPAYLVSFIFSFVWYWNESTLSALYFGNKIKTLTLGLQNFTATYQNIYSSSITQTGKSINEAINMAGTLLTILPLLIFYFVFQRWFVESVDRTGITGE
ncbi:carbohydrate ABC transporter permease [Marinitoga aeolica]|uniref:Carbohydrate ABC transporter permease n=1 Tax=Marinitoga aeolica TaxID=2809031 RepID=A0ABY8PPR5_9BACT|nr:carbohydrate ABC transporter permease [Marinitoga aeolica]WGS64619.1 carbohydrate ABC transporter permease [Marinitoga aeolica]